MGKLRRSEKEDRYLWMAGQDAEIRAWRHEFPDWQESIPSRAGKRALYGNPHAPAKPVHVIERVMVRNRLFSNETLL